MSAQGTRGFLEQANAAFLAGNYRQALELYKRVLSDLPELTQALAFNIDSARNKLNMTEAEFNQLMPVGPAAVSATGSAAESAAKQTKPVHTRPKGPSVSYSKVFESLSVSRQFDDAFQAFWASNEAAIASTLASATDTYQPLVSVIMPAFNRGAIIGQSIATVLEQSYSNFELLICDDGSTDDTKAAITALGDPRIHYIYQTNQGAAVARNTALAQAAGEIICYLDSDNYWHPDFLQLVVHSFANNQGRSALYFDFVDYRIDKNNAIHINYQGRPAFHHESLMAKPFIDLNSFAHKRELYDAFGGFDERLSRRQDYDLILKYTWLRDPLHIQLATVLYQRNDQLQQITRLKRGDNTPVSIINRKLEDYLSDGLPIQKNAAIKKVSVIIWDICRNHFSKPFSVAEALSKHYEVELISFDFFNEGVFEPLREVEPPFVTKYFKGSDFPDFFAMLRAGMDAVTGDVMYVVKPRLPSLGLALLVNYERSIPLALEINDLETVVNSPKEGDSHEEVLFENVPLHDKELLNPHSGLWSTIFDPISKQLPALITHNQGLDDHYQKRTLYMRNLKDEQVYDPGRYDRARIREELGFAADDRIILFGGLLRKHKGIYELVELVEKLQDKRYKLLFVGSRPTPDQAKLVNQFKDLITILPPQDRVGMARINYAADLVILWLNPEVPASHYQFPYKASDAFAMEVPVIANSISDLGDLARQGYITDVPFGDWDAMVAAINTLFSDDDYRLKQVRAARRLYLRQFSFNAARGNFEIINRRLLADSAQPYAVSDEFAARFNEFYRLLSQSSAPFAQRFEGVNRRLIGAHGMATPAGFGQFDEDAAISFVGLDSLSSPAQPLPAWRSKVCVLMLANDSDKALSSARLMVKRAAYPIDLVILQVNAIEQGALAGLQKVLASSASRLVLVCDEHAFACRDWLELGQRALQQNHSSWLFANSAVNFDPQAAHTLAEYVLANKSVWVEALQQLQQADWQGDFWRQLGNHIRRSKQVSFAADCLLANMSALAVNNHALTANSEIHLVDVGNLPARAELFHHDICVVMPCINHQLGLKTADLLQARAGIAADFVVAVDSQRQGFIKTLNQVARCSRAKYVVYLAEDAFPGENWLKIAYDSLESSNKGLLAFNCGKWHGRVAAFGMVRKHWVETLYQDAILFAGYRTHRADNEIAVLAKASDQFVYAVASVLIENDIGKDFKRAEAEASNFSEADKKLFKQRYKQVLPTLVSAEALDRMFDSYFNQRKLAAEKPALEL